MLYREVVQLVRTALLWAYLVETEANLPIAGTHNYLWKC